MLCRIALVMVHCHHSGGAEAQSNHRACSPDQPFQPLCLFFGTRPPAHHSIKRHAGNNGLVKHVQELGADVKGGQPPQEVDPALTLLVDGLHVGSNLI